MKDHIPFLTPLKASDQSRAIGELKFKQTTKPSILYSDHVLCPGLTHRSLPCQCGQQEMVERGFTKTWHSAVVYLFFAESSAAQLTFYLLSLCSFLCLFTFNPKLKAPESHEDVELVGQRKVQ